MQKTQRGVALVEAVLAMVLLGIVVVTALGQFNAFPDRTTTAAYNSVDAKISSAAAINYTARILDPPARVAFRSGADCSVAEYTAAFPSDPDIADYGTAASLNCR